MARFKVRSFSSGKGFVTRSVQAEDEAQVRADVEREGERLVSLAREGAWLRAVLGHRLKRRFSVALFARELLTLLDAGMTLVEAVAVLASKARDEGSKPVLTYIQRSLSEGLSLSVALTRQPEVFSPLFVATVRSSEQTGALPEALTRFLAYVANINLVRNKLIGASIYPLILLGTSAGLIMFMAVYVVPRFSRIYSDMGEHLPWISRLMVKWAQMLASHGGGIAGLAILTVIAGGVLISRGNFLSGVTRMLWRVPAIGSRARTYELARFTRTLSMLIDGGIAFVPALKMTTDVLHQPSLKVAVQDACVRVGAGFPVSESFAATGLATDVGVRLLMVGERSGDLAGMLQRISNMYDRELELAIEWMSRLLEPVMMIVIGVLIGVVILLMYLPIFELSNLMN